MTYCYCTRILVFYRYIDLTNLFPTTVIANFYYQKYLHMGSTLATTSGYPLLRCRFSSLQRHGLHLDANVLRVLMFLMQADLWLVDDFIIAQSCSLSVRCN